jgi:hypothetical protein
LTFSVEREKPDLRNTGENNQLSVADLFLLAGIYFEHWTAQYKE